MTKVSKHNETLLTFSEVNRLLDYNPETGEIHWKVDKSRAVKAGAKAGSLDKITNCVRIAINGKRYLAHRLAWFITTGKYPAVLIDHKDGDPSNNKLCNLREATCSENAMNRKKRTDCSTGSTGVTYRKDLGKYQARCAKNGKRLSLGFYDTKEEATEVYNIAAKSMHNEFYSYEATTKGEKHE